RRSMLCRRSRHGRRRPRSSRASARKRSLRSDSFRRSPPQAHCSISQSAASALLDIAQHGAADIKENPALWWLINYKDSRWAGFGIDEELKRRGLYDPDRVAIRETVVPAPPETSALPAIAAIASLQGNRERGEQAARACLMCHRIDGEGVDYGPGIEGFASRQTKEV